MAEPIDIPALIETDARVYLRETEHYRFADGIVSDAGPYKFGDDYTLGDVVGIYDDISKVSTPVRVVEVILIFEPGSTVKTIPTFSDYLEKDPEKQQ